MIINIFLIIFGCIFVAYDFILIALNPGHFLDNLTSFTHIWMAFGGYLVFLGIYRQKTGHSFYKIWKKWVKTCVKCVLFASVIVCFIVFSFILRPQYCEKDAFSADYLVLLGGGISKDGVLPVSVKNRVKKAYEYLEANPKCECVVSGGTLKWIACAEAPAIKALLVEMGIPEERILIEDKSLDTIQNLIFSAELLSKENKCSIQEILQSKVIIVTSFFHLRRAQILAQRLGYRNINGYYAKTPVFYILHLYVREVCAYIKLALRLVLTNEPKAIL